MTKGQISHLDVLVAMGDNQCNVFSISSVISAIVSCKTQTASMRKEQKKKVKKVRFYSLVESGELKAEEKLF